MAKIIDGKVYYNTSEVTEIINISMPMVRILAKKGWFSKDDVCINNKKERNYYFFSEEAVEKLKKAYGERKI